MDDAKEVEYHLLAEDVESKFGNSKECIVDTKYGPLCVTVDCRSDKPKPAILITYHDLGLNASSCFGIFCNHPAMQKVLSFFKILHINAPGQEMGAEPLGESYKYPTIPQLASQISAVTKHFGVKHFVGLGVGVGGNILSHYMAENPFRCMALILVGSPQPSIGWLGSFSYKRMLSNLDSEINTSVVKYYLSRYFSVDTRKRNPDLVTSVASDLRKRIPQNLKKFAESFYNWKALPDTLKTSRERVMLCVNENDESSILSAGGEIFPTANVERMPLSHVGVLITEEDPEALAKPIEFFLGGVGFIFTDVRRTSSRKGKAKARKPEV